MIGESTPRYAQSPEQLPGSYFLSSFEQLTPDEQSNYEQAMRQLLEPLYGNQDESLDKIRKAEDRRAEVVLDNRGELCATFVYKTNLVSEVHRDMHTGATARTDEAFEIKTLALFHPEKDGGKGLGSWLANRAETLARAAEAKGIVFMITDQLQATQDFFTHREGYRWILHKAGKTPETSGPLLYKSLEP